MDSNTNQIICASIGFAGAIFGGAMPIIVPIIIKRFQRRPENKDIPQTIPDGGQKMKRINLIPLISICAFVSCLICYSGSNYLMAQINKPETPYIVYSDTGIPNGDIWVWSGADWGKAQPILVEGNYETGDVPEGKRCFAVIAGTGSGNYIGWGVFLGTFQDHVCIQPDVVDVSHYKQLQFFVKSAIDLKVEIQQENKNGRKSIPCNISQYGWTPFRRDKFQEISIPKKAFKGVNYKNIFSPFMITGTGNQATFYVDNVRWVP